MQKFMCIHTLGPDALSRKEIDKFAEAAQQDRQVRGYRSFVNLSEGKIVCILESPDKQTLSNWFNKMGMPVDSITRVEYEGDRGSVLASEGSGASASAPAQ